MSDRKRNVNNEITNDSSSVADPLSLPLFMSCIKLEVVEVALDLLLEA